MILPTKQPLASAERRMQPSSFDSEIPHATNKQAGAASRRAILRAQHGEDAAGADPGVGARVGKQGKRRRLRRQQRRRGRRRRRGMR